MPVLINDVPPRCIIQAEAIYHVPVVLILSVMRQENGRNGQAVKNKNGSYDLGVMQINTRWLPALSRYGYTQEDLQYDPCKNVMAGTWILANNIATSNMLWAGIGNYHSHTPQYNASYQNDIYKHYKKISAVLNISTASVS
ncbi:MAG: lytic transglycosylase domain-containing protein [Gammaproteobacteria bacterium]